MHTVNIVVVPSLLENLKAYLKSVLNIKCVFDIFCNTFLANICYDKLLTSYLPVKLDKRRSSNMSVFSNVKLPKAIISCVVLSVHLYVCPH